MTPQFDPKQEERMKKLQGEINKLDQFLAVLDETAQAGEIKKIQKTISPQ